MRNTRNRWRAVPYAAVSGALSLSLLFLGWAAPGGVWGIVALAGLGPAACVMSAGLGTGFLCWAGVSLLAFLLLPGKFTALLFAALFGLYPMVKALGERLRVRGVEYAVKLAFFNASLTVAYFAMRAALTASLPGALGAVWALYAVGNVVFLIYDYGLSRLFALYMKRIQRNIR